MAIEGPGYEGAPPDYGSGSMNYVWEGDAETGRWITIDEWNAIHNPQPIVPDERPPDGGSVIEGGGSTTGDRWNGGSPPAMPLQPGYGWEWNGSDWAQVQGRGLGFTTGGGGYTGGGGGGGYTGGYEGGEWQAPPDFNAPRWQAPPEFVYGKQFAAPTPGDLTLDPSFQFRMDQGRKALEQSAAGKGVLRTGGTLKDLVNYGQNFATNEYANVYNRKFNEYKFDYDKEADIYARNYNLKRDVFDRNYKAAYDEYSPKLRGWEVKANRDWQKYLSDRENEQQDFQ